MFQRWRHKGASLIEILISLVVISVGMLGIAGLQVTQLRQIVQVNTDYNVGLSVIDIMDSMQANPEGVENGDYNNITSSAVSSYKITNCNLIPLNKGCGHFDTANNDALRWLTAIATLLPGSTASIKAHATKPNTFTIEIQSAKRNSPYTYEIAL
jgi:type IV pilus assembly protein PilV